MHGEKLITILGDIGKGMLDRENRIREKIGLSEAEYKGVLCMDREKKINCREFSRRMDLSLSRGSRVIDRLCVKQYIERVDCDADRRCKNIWLTPKGNEVRQMIAKEIQDLERALISGYPDAKLELLKSDLRRLSQRL